MKRVECPECEYQNSVHRKTCKKCRSRLDDIVRVVSEESLSKDRHKNLLYVLIFGALFSLILLGMSFSAGGESRFFMWIGCLFPVLSATVAAGIFWIAAAKNILSTVLIAAIIGAIVFFLLVLTLFLVLMFGDSGWPRSEPFLYALIAAPFGAALGAIIGTIVGMIVRFVKSKSAA